MQTLFAALLSSVIVLAPVAPALAQAPGSPECKRQLFFAEPALKQSRDRLKEAVDGSGAEKCRLWREYSTALNSGRAVFGRCLAEPARSRRVSETAAAAAEIDRAIASQCSAAAPGRARGGARHGDAPVRSMDGPTRLVPSQ